MAKVYAISIFKGGTGKTTTAVNLAFSLANLEKGRGKRTLLIDLDAQASATRHLGIDPEKINPTLFNVFMKQAPTSMAIMKTPFDLDLLPGHPLLSAIEEALEPGDELMLKEMISGILPEYDYVIIDSPPGKTMLSFTALGAANAVIIPLLAERPALDGTTDILKYIQEIVWEKYNPELNIRGILPTMVKRYTSHSISVVDKARKLWGNKVFPVEIPATINFPRAFNEGRPLVHYKSWEEGSRMYFRLAEIIDEKS